MPTERSSSPEIAIMTWTPQTQMPESGSKVTAIVPKMGQNWSKMGRKCAENGLKMAETCRILAVIVQKISEIGRKWSKMVEI